MLVSIQVNNEVMTVVVRHGCEPQVHELVREAKQQLDALEFCGKMSGELMQVWSDVPELQAFVVAFISERFDVVCLYAEQIGRFVVVSSKVPGYSVGDTLYPTALFLEKPTAHRLSMSGDVSGEKIDHVRLNLNSPRFDVPTTIRRTAIDDKSK